MSNGSAMDHRYWLGSRGGRVGGCFAAALLLLSVVVGTSGCDRIASKGAGTTVAPTPGQAWPFTPAEMRFHPFTAISGDEQPDATLIEARVTFHDRWGDTTKAVGRLRFELSLPGASGTDDPSLRQRINAWEADLSSPERSVVHFESISRTYLFKLRLPQTLPADRTYLLTARFNAPSGNRLHAETKLTLEAGGE